MAHFVAEVAAWRDAQVGLPSAGFLRIFAERLDISRPSERPPKLYVEAKRHAAACRCNLGRASTSEGRGTGSGGRAWQVTVKKQSHRNTRSVAPGALQCNVLSGHLPLVRARDATAALLKHSANCMRSRRICAGAYRQVPDKMSSASQIRELGASNRTGAGGNGLSGPCEE